MSCDNLISADVVTADGRLLVASETENADLFWALRGGGGNFGVVTSFEYRLHPVGPMVAFAGPVYPLEQTARVMAGFRDFVAGAPDEINASATWWSIPAVPGFPEEIHGREVLILGAMYAGPPDGGRGAPDAPAPVRGADPGSLHDPSLHRPPTALRSLLPSGRAAPLLEVALPRRPRQRGRRRDRGVGAEPPLADVDGRRVGARWRARSGRPGRDRGWRAQRPLPPRDPGELGRNPRRPSATSPGRATSSPPWSASAPARRT